ncbi:formate/nitrite transporter family protein [Paenibacillus oenotherae]|uniref:Formate/nitrite transporter family protein n=1 Tax=Paenibacillus oenotherae TaxID=1435645 RepID=A0ABS7D8U1_9BACL|nr:formate/nitrite transporter family protein [Paenibacillus oenotherae]MBW7476360.1 formate/nitrite transporter family protein [Paenibacillus oenotherae]
MYKDTLDLVVKSALARKALFDESKGRYLLSSGLAGAYVGIGIILIFTVGAALAAAHSPVTSLVMGLSFGIALTLVIFAGSELFTGNNMIFTVSSLSKATTWGDAWRNWLWCYSGNLLGAMALCLIIVGTGLFAKIPPDHLLFTIAAKKMNLDVTQLFFRGIMCNWLVCLAIWTSMRAKEDTAKLILIFWMLFAFIASGYEHSIANMTVLGLALLLPHPDTITIAGWFQNMIPVTLGNMVGGALFVGTFYWIISPLRKKV